MKFNPLIPELTVLDLEKSINFYVEVLGFQIEYRREESKFAFVSFQGSQLMLEERNGGWETAPLDYPFGRGINFQIEVNQLDLIINALTDAKYPIVKASWVSWYRRDDQMLGAASLT